jgi:hypothetical protein
MIVQIQAQQSRGIASSGFNRDLRNQQGLQKHGEAAKQGLLGEVAHDQRGISLLIV